MSVKVVWGMVSYGPFPYAPVYSSHLQAIAYASRYFATAFADGSKIAGVAATDRMYTHSAENRLVEEFLESDGTHLFMCEMDNVLPMDTITKLVALNQPIASGLYVLRGGKGQPCLYRKMVTSPENPYTHSPVSVFPTDRPFQVDPYGGGCVGVGCVLIRRDVFETVPYPWFDLKEKFYGSDMYFYTKVRDAKIPVWVDPTVRVGHMDYIEYTYDDYEKRLREDPDFRGNGVVISGLDEAVAARG